MTINFSLRSCFGIQASNTAPAAGQATPCQSSFRQAVKRLCTALFQCKSASADTTDQLMQQPPTTDHAAHVNANQQLIKHKTFEFLLSGLDGKLEPETKARLAVALAMTKTWGNDSHPLIRFSRASNPESLPDPRLFLGSLGLQSGKRNLAALETLCGLFQKKIYPMMHAAMDHPASAASLGNWLSKVFALGKPQPRIDWMRHMDEPMLEEFIRLMGAPVSSTDSPQNQQARQAPVQNALLIKRLFNDINNFLMGTSQINLTEQQKSDKATALAVAIHASWQFPNLSPAMRADKAFVLAALKASGGNLSHVAPALKNDREVVLAAVSRNGSVLQEVGDEFRADKAVVMAAVKSNGRALEYALGDLQADREVTLEAVRSSGHALKMVSPQWHADPEVVQAACLNECEAFQFASDALKRDRSFVLQLVSRVGASLKYASAELQNDEEVVKAAVSNHGSSLKYASKTLQDNKQVVLAAVSQDAFALNHASDRLKDDTDVVLAAISRKEPHVVIFNSLLSIASKRLQSNRAVALAAVLKEPKEFLRLGPELKDDKQIVMAAVSSNENAFKKASKRLQLDPDVVMAASKWSKPGKEGLSKTHLRYQEALVRKDPSLLHPESSGKKGPNFEKLMDNKQYVTFAVSLRGDELERMNPSMKNDKDVVKVAYLQNPNSLQYASDELKNDRAFFRELYMASQKYRKSSSA